MMSDVAARKGTLVDPVDRLSRISRILAITTGAAMLVVTLAVVGAWLVPMLTGVTLVPRLGRFARFFDDPLARTTAFAVIVGLLGVFLYALEQARRLFGEFAAGEILTSRAAMRLQRISYAVIAGSIAKPAAQFLLQV